MNILNFFKKKHNEEYKPNEVNEENEFLSTDIKKEDNTPMFISKNTKPQAVKVMKKSLVYTVAGSVFLVSAYSIFSGPSTPPSNKLQSTESSISTNNSGQITDKPSTYAGLAKYNKELKKKNQIEEAATGTTAADSMMSTYAHDHDHEHHHEQPRQDVRNNQSYAATTTQSSYQSQPYYASSSPSYSSVASMNKSSYDSAIAFALGNHVPSTTATATTNSEKATIAGAYQENSYALVTGTLVPVTLINGIISSLSGQVTAQVREPVYDSLTGSVILIPAGSKMIGTYNSDDMSEGRINIVFTRIILPNGQTIALNNVNGVDNMGFLGVKDQYTEHTGRAVGASFVTSILAGIASLASDGDGKEHKSRSQESIDEAIGNMISTGNEIVKKRLESDPTATIRPGYEFNVQLNADLYLSEYRG